MACNSVQTHHLHPFNPPPSTYTPNTLNFTSLNLTSPKFHPISSPPSLKTKTHISFPKPNNGYPFVCSAAQEIGIEETGDNSEQEEFISGEWPENFSLLNYDDLRAHLEPEIFKDKMEPSALLGEVMSTTIRTATVEQSLEEIDHHFEFVSGLPVIDEGFVCIGVISRKDKLKASDGLKSKVGEVMSSPAITLIPNKTVLEAAVLMLKKKLHRIPVVNEGGQVVGMVTRTDIFKALEGLPA